VPFELLKTGHMTVMVKVNGQGPYRLIFDTGAPITLLNTKIAKEAGLLKNMPRSPFALFGTMGEARVKQLLVGEQLAEDVAAVVMDHPTVEAISKAFGPIDGIVGFPFFARFRMTLDYQAKTMTFVPSGFKPPDVMKGLMMALLKDDSEAKVLAPAAQWGILAQKPARDEEAGVDVKEVLAGSAAAAAGLKAGDRLLTLDGRWTDSLVDLYTAAGLVAPGTTVVLTVRRDGKVIELKVTPVAGL
jgi:membrane-associated protease RseP (regulator of RpoE activity)